MILFLFLGCGTSSNTNVLGASSESGLKNLELYSPNLKFVKGSQRYDVEKVDALTSELSFLYYDARAKQFTTIHKNIGKPMNVIASQNLQRDFSTIV